MTGHSVPSPRIPASMYRLQFNGAFTFANATAVVPYLHALGITDIYASPYFKAKKGSTHGYDIVDHTTLNPEIGSEEDYQALIAGLRMHEMGQVLDIVPNHMCITSEDNRWWTDVLENGHSSSYASFFDIDWEPIKKELKNKVLLPILGDQYGNVLERQELNLSFEGGAFFVSYFEHRFPIRPQTYIPVLEHRIDDLCQTLTGKNADFAELLSIITALRHLPPYTEIDEEKVIERNREKEVIKKRLSHLCSKNETVRTFIEENVEIFNGTAGKPRSFDLLDELLSDQVYRLSHWSVATEEINYRRFFDINSLAAIKMENRQVIDKTHELIFRLIREGAVTGLRVDHPDGLYNPTEYFHHLQRNCFVQTRLAYLSLVDEERETGFSPRMELELAHQYDEAVRENPQFKPFYIVGEKILIKGERMPEEWPIFSTTGYVFLNSVNGLFIDGRNTKKFDDIYGRFIRGRINFSETTYERKKLIMLVAMSSEINTLGHYLNTISEKNRHTRDFTLLSLTRAIREVIALFPVYRTYVSGNVVTDRDRQYIELAVLKAKRKNPAMSESIFDFLRDVLLLRYPDYFSEGEKREWLDFTMKFQQITGPVMAKGVEDTSFYIYNRFISLNEVGGSPERFGTPPETFHGQNFERSKFWKDALISTSTHDTKRSEDVRARINVLSEIPDLWQEALRKWGRLNRKRKAFIDGQRTPDRNEEYFLYQTLIGAWPVGGTQSDGYESFIQRIKDCMLKAVREAKVNTSWINRNNLYEDALLLFIDNILRPSSTNRFLSDFESFQRTISDFGMYNSLSQTLLKITSPGLPDFYQGTEIWDFNLVDPDNRRPVDYTKRIALLNALKERESTMTRSELARRLLIERDDGAIKLYTIYRALNFRRENRSLFELGEYLPLEVSGERSAHVCAFARRSGNTHIVAAVPRFLTRLVPARSSLPIGEEVWGNTTLNIPFAEGHVRYRNIFTGDDLTVREQGQSFVLTLSEVFGHFPVALMTTTHL